MPFSIESILKELDDSLKSQHHKVPSKRSIPHPLIRFQSDSGVKLASHKVSHLNGTYSLIFQSVHDCDPVTVFNVNIFDQSKWKGELPQIAFDPDLVRAPSQLEIDVALSISEDLFPNCFSQK